MHSTLEDSPQVGVDASVATEHLTRRFGWAAIVNDVTLRIPAGTTCGLLGLNGAGKSTLIRMIMGLLKPTSGWIGVAGCEIPAQRDRARRLIGYVPDQPTVYRWMTGRAAVAFCKSIYGGQWNDGLVSAAAKSLRLDLNKKVKHLSKGSAAKLSLLLAIGHDPAVLVLDEPTSGFDVLARDEFLEGLLTVNTAATEAGRPGRTVLFSSHSISDVHRLADSVAVLHRGKLLLHRPIDSLLSETRQILAVLADPSDPTTAPAGTLRESRVGREWTMTVKDFSSDQVDFVRARNGIAHLDVRELTLEDVFREYVTDRANADSTPTRFDQR
jgi:ABC-2 type transport system ATP-binding protein